MPLFEELLAELKDDPLTDQVRRLCDVIYKEEERNQKHADTAPIGPNTFLCLEVPGKTKNEIGYLSLERDSVSKYLAVFNTINRIDLQKIGEEPKIKRQNVWTINEDNAKKILIEYAKRYKYLRGE